MINVVFKNSYNNSYGNKEYIYQDYENVQVGDIVAVNTVNGLSVAKVSRINVENYDFDIDKIKSVAKVIKTKEEIEAEEVARLEKQRKMNEFVRDAKKVVLLNELRALNSSSDARKLLDSLNLDELEALYKKIKG